MARQPKINFFKSKNPPKKINTSSVYSGQGGPTYFGQGGLTGTAPQVQLQRGATGANVKALQDYLVANGYMTKDQLVGGYGTFGPLTEAAVKSFQMEQGVDNSTGPGIWGPRTYAATVGGTPNTGGTGEGTNPSTVLTPGTPEYQNQVDASTAQVKALQAQFDALKNKTTPQASNTSTATGDRHYGIKTTAENAQQLNDDEHYAARLVNATHEQSDLQNKLTGLINKPFLDKMMNDPEKLLKWVHAIAFGGYTTGDVLQDMKREELLVYGTPAEKAAAKALTIISPTATKDDYLATPEGSNALAATRTLMPKINADSIGGSEWMNYGLLIPDSMFKTLVPLEDRTSDEFKQAVEDVKSMYYYDQQAKLLAKTEQEKAVAEDNWNIFKDKMERDYGITLSDNAAVADKQMKTFDDSYNTRGIQGSGLENEAVDDYMKKSRLTDARSREERILKEEEQLAATTKASATPAQIQRLIDEDIAHGVPESEWRVNRWGLGASSELSKMYSMTNLRKEFPDMSEEDIQRYHDSAIDENGNVRSTLYQSYWDNLLKSKTNQKTDAETEVFEQAGDKEKDVYSLFDRSEKYIRTTDLDKQRMQEIADKEGLPATDGVDHYQNKADAIVDSDSKLPLKTTPNTYTTQATPDFIKAFNAMTPTQQATYKAKNPNVNYNGTIGAPTGVTPPKQLSTVTTPTTSTRQTQIDAINAQLKKVQDTYKTIVSETPAKTTTKPTIPVITTPKPIVSNITAPNPAPADFISAFRGMTPAQQATYRAKNPNVNYTGV